MSITIPNAGNFKNAKDEIISIKKQIEATLNIVGIQHLLLKPSELMAVVDEIFNKDISNRKDEYDVKRIWNPLDELNIQMLSQELDLKVEEDILKLHDENTEIKTFAINGYPPEWTLYQMGDLIGNLYRESRQFPYPYIFHYGIHIPKQSNGVAKIAVKANLVGTQLRTPIGKYIPGQCPDIEREYAELEFVQQNLAKGERLVNTRFGIVLFAPKDEMAEVEQILKTGHCPYFHRNYLKSNPIRAYTPNG